MILIGWPRVAALAGSLTLIVFVAALDYAIPNVNLGYLQVFAILLFASAAPYRTAAGVALGTAVLEAFVEAGGANAANVVRHSGPGDLAANVLVMACSFVAVVTLFDRLKASFVQNVALERAAHMATILEQAFVPSTLPTCDGLVFDATYSPAKHELNVGGDWYDVVPLPNGLMLFCVGDVTGHGVRAALGMGRIRQSILTAAANIDDVGEILRCANRATLFQQNDLATIFVGLLDPRTLAFAYANAGHPAPIVTSQTGSVRTLDGRGPILGVSHAAGYDQYVEQLASGDMLVLYTDGLIEFDRRVIEAEAKLVAIAADISHEPVPKRPAATIRARMLGAAAQNDDLVVVTVRLQAQPAMPVSTVRAGRFLASTPAAVSSADS